VSRLLSFVTRERLHFALVSGGAFFVLTGLCYYLYGYQFLYESLLYHLIRKDNRHNFSVYFYHLYLSFERPESFPAGLAAFLPQFLLILLLSVKYYRDVIFCVFLQTYVFVVFNKVCTAQYFLWYIGLLPLIVPSSTMSGRRGLALAALWIATEVHWLAWAYQLEFMGNNAFLQVWAASAIFFAANAYIISQIIRFHRFDHSRGLKLE
jgi:phosphatidylinositol glycan class M